MDALIPEEIPPEGVPLRGTPYVVLKRLGKGAQGMALLVKNPDLARLEVMKILLVAYNEELGFRFKFEAQAIAAIVHGAIVRIHSVGILPDQRPYFTMEYVEGETLSQRMRSLGGPMPVRRALLIATQLAEGLAAAHAKGIVHRDLKPGNILIAPDDSVKIIDFGIAKRAQEHTQLNGGWTQGNLIGTPTFMAPEQAMGTATAIGPATDIYALGCVLYMLLTNRLVYEGNTAEQIYHKLHTNPPTLAAAGTGGPFPPELDPLLRRMLERDPAARLQTATELRQELNRILKGLPSDVTVPVSSDAGFDAPTVGATYSTAVQAATPPPDLGNFPTVRDAAPSKSAPAGWHEQATVDSPVARGREVTAADSPAARGYREPTAEVVTAPVQPATAPRRGGLLLLGVAVLVLGAGGGRVGRDDDAQLEGGDAYANAERDQCTVDPAGSEGVDRLGEGAVALSHSLGEQRAWAERFIACCGLVQACRSRGQAQLNRAEGLGFHRSFERSFSHADAQGAMDDPF